MKRYGLWLILTLLAIGPVSAEESVSPPATSLPPAEEGFASWYGGKFQGRRTASGEVFDTHQYTAAHRTLPFGTMVKVTNLDNRKTTVVRITDRGPFVDERVIDLSQAAAIDLDMMKTGVARVSVEILPREVEAMPREDGQAKAEVFRIQVASFKDQENALKTKLRLTEKGYRVFFERSAAGHFRVQVDNVAHGELETVKGALRELGFIFCLVRKIE